MLNGRTKGGLNAKIHAVVDARSLSGGNQADISLVEELTECLIGDKAYDSSTLRQTAATKGINTCIPGRRNRTMSVPLKVARLFCKQ
jgi:hypothetical protein